MAKDKSGSKAAAAPVASKPIESVKAGRVTKPEKSSKAVPDKKHKREREPSPDTSDDESDGTSDSSASSDDGSDSEEEVDTEVDKKVVNGGSDSGSDSDSSASDSEDEKVAKKAEAPKINGTAKVDSAVEKDAPKTNGKAKASMDDDDDSATSDSDSSSSDSDSDSDSGSEDGDGAEVDAKAGAKKPADDTSSASSSEDEAELPAVKAEEAAKKRKAEAPIDQTPKKAKVNSNEDQTGAVANLFIGNLSWNIDEEWLTREFEEFGEIKGVRVITDRDSGRSKGFGYVEFMAVDSAVQAYEAKNGELLDGRNIRIDYSTPRPQKNNDGFTPQQRGADRAQRYGDVAKPPSKTLFVGNVSFNADENMLTELFQDHGSIAAVRLPTDRETGELKGFGYVEFSSIDEAKGAFEALQGAAIEGRPIRLDYAGERSNDSPRGGGFSRGGGGGRGGRGGFNDRGGRGGGFGDRGRGRGGARGGRGGTTNRGGFGDFSGKKVTF